MFTRVFFPLQHDPISELLQSHFPTAARKTLPSVESVSMDMARLRRLVVSLSLTEHSLLHPISDSVYMYMYNVYIYIVHVHLWVRI